MRHRYADAALAEFIAAGRFYNRQVPGLATVGMFVVRDPILKRRRWGVPSERPRPGVLTSALRKNSRPGDSCEQTAATTARLDALPPFLIPLLSSLCYLRFLLLWGDCCLRLIAHQILRQEKD